MRLVISDTHIGDRHSDRNLGKLYKLLETFASPTTELILNGDILDLAKHLSFDSRHHIFFELIQKYGNVNYIVGNHDWLLSGIGSLFPKIKFCSALKFQLLDKTVFICHGHQFDWPNYYLPSISRAFIWANKWIDNLTSIDIQHFARHSWLVQNKIIPKQIDLFYRKLTGKADILISGHTHRIESICRGNISYYNTGDWVGKETAYLIIDENRVELIRL